MDQFHCKSMTDSCSTKFPAEINDILSALSPICADYAIFAGFGCFLVVGTETSNDVDVLFKDEPSLRSVQREFAKKGWQVVKDGLVADGARLNVVLQKNNCELDLVYSPHSARHLLPQTVDCVFNGMRLRCLSAEALLLVKLAQMTNLERKTEKLPRDRDTINRLRQVADGQKLRQLAAELEEQYWLKGNY